ncbi:MAG: hypothetical protein HYV90_05855 [Candidatus Woesebacteria bacterium]|nr:MAG: hypothetical protein HYV90_05855 [Candidatus Woesebacteria bacterium]
MWSRIYEAKRAVVPVAPPVSLPTAITNQGGLYEYCVINENSPDSSRHMAGTDVPDMPVPINPTGTPEVVREIATLPVPTKPANKIPISRSDIEVSKRFSQKNFHIVIVGFGFSKTEIPVVMAELIERIQKNFEGVDVDFSYLKIPMEAEFDHVGPEVYFKNESYKQNLFDSIRAVYPMDSMISGINTNLGLGTSQGTSAIFTINDMYVATFIMTHEIGHQFGIGDGYHYSYPPGWIPNSELFYLDQMPPNLARAVKELGHTPPMYLMGTCQGKPVYQFYDTKFNIYGDWEPTGPNPWGDSPFTPLQILIMNDYIRDR